MSPTDAAALAGFLLVFAPLAFLYGLRVAARVQARARRDGRSALALLAPKLVLPAFVAAALLVRFSGTGWEGWMQATASGTLSAALAAFWFAGSLFGILFFLSIPFVFGRLFALLAVSLGWFAQGASEAPTPEPPETLSFRERARRAAGEDEDEDEAP